MNSENAHQYLPFIEALTNGKTVQYLHMGEWIDGICLTFDKPPEHYRIKPRPVEYKVWRNKNTGVMYTVISKSFLDDDVWECITIREIRDEQPAEPLSKPEFDWLAFWKGVPTWCNYIAMDEDGWWHYYEFEPRLRMTKWEAVNIEDKDYIPIPSSDSPPSMYWKESVIKRP